MSMITYLNWGIIEKYGCVFNHSMNNAPLLRWIYRALGIPDNVRFLLYILMMVCLAFIVRKCSYENILLIYLVALVSFSSAIANQYMAIPMVVLCIFDIGILRYLYMIFISAYLVINENGLNLIGKISESLTTIQRKMLELYNRGGDIIAAWLLLIVLVYVIFYKQCRSRGRQVK